MKIQNNFTKGTINKDSDERLVAANELIDAENFFVTTTEGSNAGVGKNVPGNVKKTNYNILGGKTIGVGDDESKNRIFNFIKGTQFDYIIEYNVVTNTSETVLQATTGGVLNIIRTPVTMEYGADISMTIGDFGRQDFKAVINVPIIEDKMGLKIFGASIQSDGHVYNSTLKRDVGGDDKVNLGFAAQWEPNENLSIKLHHEIMNDQSEQGAYVNGNTVGMLACTITQIGFDPYNGCEKDANDGPDLTESDGSNFSDNEYKTTILTVNYDTENFLYTFI